MHSNLSSTLGAILLGLVTGSSVSEVASKAAAVLPCVAAQDGPLWFRLLSSPQFLSTVSSALAALTYKHAAPRIARARARRRARKEQTS
jgi:hypothetical protein